MKIVNKKSSQSTTVKTVDKLQQKCFQLKFFTDTFVRLTTLIIEVVVAATSVTIKIAYYGYQVTGYILWTLNSLWLMYLDLELTLTEIYDVVWNARIGYG